MGARCKTSLVNCSSALFKRENLKSGEGGALCSICGMWRFLKDESCLTPLTGVSRFVRVDEFDSLIVVGEGISLLTGSWDILPVFWHYVTIGRNSVCWVSLCRLRSTFLWNALPHKSQANGLNPVCFLEWVMRFEDWLNALPQTVHLCGFSPKRKKKFVKKIESNFCVEIIK